MICTVFSINDAGLERDCIVSFAMHCVSINDAGLEKDCIVSSDMHCVCINDAGLEKDCIVSVVIHNISINQSYRSRKEYIASSALLCILLVGLGKDQSILCLFCYSLFQH